MKPILLVVAGPNGAGMQLRKVYGPLPGWVSDVAQSLSRHHEYVDVRVA